MLKRGAPLHHMSVAGAEGAMWSHACAPLGLNLPGKHGPGCITGQVSKLFYPNRKAVFFPFRKICNTEDLLPPFYLLSAHLLSSPRPLFPAHHRGLWGSSTCQHIAAHSRMRHRPLPERYPETWSQVWTKARLLLHMCMVLQSTGNDHCRAPCSLSPMQSHQDGALPMGRNCSTLSTCVSAAKWLVSFWKCLHTTRKGGLKEGLWVCKEKKVILLSKGHKLLEEIKKKKNFLFYFSWYFITLSGTVW